MQVELVAACVIGTVLGYITHFLIRRDANPGVKDLAAIVGVILGAGVLGVVGQGPAVSWYMIGIGIGFFLYWLALMVGREGPQPKDFFNPASTSRELTLFPFIR
jgi:Na+-translocating ferredoxin:NAD+ oxidoreductase RnfD subunit